MSDIEKPIKRGPGRVRPINEGDRAWRSSDISAYASGAVMFKDETGYVFLPPSQVHSVVFEDSGQSAMPRWATSNAESIDF